MLASRQRLLKQPVLRRFGGLTGNRHGLDEAADRYGTVLGDVYRRIRRVTGCDVIVDNSKQPAHAYTAGRLPDCETSVLHLVRDSRAVAFSAHRHEGRGAASSARYWMAVNLRAERFWGLRQNDGGYLRVLYEDFAAEPRPTMERILQFLGEEKRPLDLFEEDSCVRLRHPNHHVEAHPDRFPPGRLKIIPDDKWSISMPRRDRLSMLALTWPLLLRYGYRASPSGPSAWAPGPASRTPRRNSARPSDRT